MRVAALLCLVAVVYGEVVDIKSCDGVAADKCTITEIRITPCSDKNACRLHKGSDASVELDFVPNFSTSTLTNKVTWNGVAWTGIGTDACAFTTCPTEAGKAQTYNATMHIGKKLPSGKYVFKWDVYDESDPSNSCCFKAAVKLVK